MKWITRARPKIDRIACPWLIQRFIDREAEFIFAPPADVIRLAAELGAIPFDVEGVELSHDGPLCSFDALLKKYRLVDPALQELAVIVRGADTEHLELAPQAAGLLAISLGLSRNFTDDHEQLKRGMVIYDALYAYCKQMVQASKPDAAPKRADAPSESKETFVAPPPAVDARQVEAGADKLKQEQHVGALEKRAHATEDVQRRNERDAPSGFVASPPPAGSLCSTTLMSTPLRE